MPTLTLSEVPLGCDVAEMGGVPPGLPGPADTFTQAPGSEGEQVGPQSEKLSTVGDEVKLSKRQERKPANSNKQENSHTREVREGSQQSTQSWRVNNKLKSQT